MASPSASLHNGSVIRSPSLRAKSASRSHTLSTRLLQSGPRQSAFPTTTSTSGSFVHDSVTSSPSEPTQSPVAAVQAALASGNIADLAAVTMQLAKTLEALQATGVRR